MSAPDYRAARVHWRRAEAHHEQAERFRQLGLRQAERDALRDADHEERLALRLEGRA